MLDCNKTPSEKEEEESDMLAAQVRIHLVFKNGGKRHGLLASFSMDEIRCTHVVSGKTL
jgi:hypothetical protein